MKRSLGFLKEVFMKDLDFESVELIRDHGYDNLIVSFGGVAGYPGMPIFEFKNIMSSTKINKMFLVDNLRSWYCYGINSTYNSVESLCSFLKDIIDLCGKKYVMFYGNSMGGFAAIKFGAILEVQRVVAFSPQSFISQRMRNKYMDNRWSDHIDKFNNKFIDTELELFSYLDSNSSTVFDIHYSVNDRLDKVHAELLFKRANINLNHYTDSDHNLVQFLKQHNKLKNILIEGL